MSTPPGDLIETVTLEVRAAGDGGKPVTVEQPPSTEVHDVYAYRLAVGAVGAAILVFLIGAAVILAVGKEVTNQYWAAGSALSGALLGILVPPAPKATSRTHAWAKFFAAIWANRTVLILLLVFAAAIWRDAEEKGTEWQSLAAAAGGALIGVLAPSPGKKG